MAEHNQSNRSAMWLATGLGVGLVTPAPGTIGGLWGLPLAWIMGEFDPCAQRVMIVLLILAAVAICTLAARALGGEKDPSAIVLDEIVALPIVYLGIETKTPVIWIVGFLLFRVFDISKPFPVRQSERLPAGWGVVADDCVAAGYAWASLHTLLRLDGALKFGWLAA